jgi:excisionase family DNA binding protein
VPSVAPPRLLTVAETAEYLGMNKNSVYTACREGRIPCYRVNGWSIRVDFDELKAWLESSRPKPNGNGP